MSKEQVKLAEIFARELNFLRKGGVWDSTQMFRTPALLRYLGSGDQTLAIMTLRELIERTALNNIDAEAAKTLLFRHSGNIQDGLEAAAALLKVDARNARLNVENGIDLIAHSIASHVLLIKFSSMFEHGIAIFPASSGRYRAVIRQRCNRLANPRRPSSVTIDGREVPLGDAQLLTLSGELMDVEWELHGRLPNPTDGAPRETMSELLVWADSLAQPRWTFASFLSSRSLYVSFQSFGMMARVAFQRRE